MTGRVLLVEDDVDVLEYYDLLLTLYGFSIWERVTTGEQAVRLVQSRPDPPDVVILDHRLPGCTGLETARQILALDPYASIVFCTADESVREEVARLGIHRFKRKPVSNARLIANVTQAVADRRRALQGRRWSAPTTV